MKKIPSCIFLLVLFITGHSGYGQLSDDSLRKICISMPCAYRTDQLKKGKGVKESVKEHFRGMFRSVKFFSVDYHEAGPGGTIYIIDDGRPYFEYFALDARSGKMAALRDFSNFNTLMAECKLCTNLDKAYIYMLFNAIEKLEITQPNEYNRDLRRKSLLARAGDVDFSTHSIIHHGTVQDYPTYEYYIKRSVPKHLYIGAQKYRDPRQELLNLYEFEFEDKGRLIKFAQVLKNEPLSRAELQH